MSLQTYPAETSSQHGDGLFILFAVKTVTLVVCSTGLSIIASPYKVLQKLFI